MCMTITELEKKVKEIKELARMKEELELEIASLQDEIKAEMVERDTDEITTNEYKIRYKEVQSNRFDTTSFKAKYSDLYNQFVKVTTSKRFTIS